MFDRPKSGQRAILVQCSPEHDDEGRLSEFRELALSAGAEPVGIIRAPRQKPDARFFLGTGKVEELADMVSLLEAELVLVNQSLSPSQERNLEKALSARVVDRTGLILDIFAQRAQSFEGKLQVELAQLRHLSTRLVRGWTHLERQKGGIGLRGPGETQLETDKRLLTNRITQIRKRLEKVEKQRNQGRAARRRGDIPVIGLVGYTNAGKSTLFNALTSSDVYAADQLFATLDPTFRRLELAMGRFVVLADTVGFIRDLPHELIAAFRSTLQEATQADLLLHVIDASDGRVRETMTDVEDTLREIGADEVPVIQVFNKIDQLAGTIAHVERWNDEELTERIWLSAVNGEGLPLLIERLSERFAGSMKRGTLHLGASEGKQRAHLYSTGRVLREQQDGEGGWLIEVEAPEWVLGQFAEESFVSGEHALPGMIH